MRADNRERFMRWADTTLFSRVAQKLEQDGVDHGRAADDPVGTYRDLGNHTMLGEDRAEAQVNRYFIKWSPSFDKDEESPWVAINHEAGLQRMPNDLMDDYPRIEAAEVANRLAAVSSSGDGGTST